jgi:hypothetical protein
MGSLEISFLGPFAYVFRPGNNTIDVYAPKCLGHHGGIFSPVDEYPLRGRLQNGKDYRYVLDSPGIKKGPATIDSKTNVLTTSSPLHPQADPAFCINVPMPFVIHGMNEAGVEIVLIATGVPTGLTQQTVTSLRFCYEYDTAQPVTLKKPVSGGAPWPFKFIFPTLPAGQSSHADLIVRYSSTLEEDVDHADAQECFRHICDLLGLPWGASYDTIGSGRLEVRSGVDCRAPIVVSK